MQQNRLAGHTLPNEGKLWVDRQLRSDVTGSSRCECGERSPLLGNAQQRRDWHRDHKDQIRQRHDTPPEE